MNSENQQRSDKNLPQKIVGLITWPFGTPKEMESPVKVEKEKPIINSLSDSPISSLTISSFSYQDFVNRMKLTQCSVMVNDVRSFVQRFSKQNTQCSWEDTVKEVTSFISKMQDTMSKHPLWKDSSKIELDNGYDGMEKLILSKIYDKVFQHFSTEDQELNDSLTKRISQLQFIKPAHLDITQPYWDHPSLTQAQTELTRLCQYKSPRDKLVCLLNACKIINGLVLQIKSMNTTRVSADEFFPLLIYAILRARPPKLWLHVLYIQSFRRITKLTGEPGYFITHIKCAMSFIENITAHSLSISVDEYNRLFSNSNSQKSLNSLNPFDINQSSNIDDNLTQNHGDRKKNEFYTKNKETISHSLNFKNDYQHNETKDENELNTKNKDAISQNQIKDENELNTKNKETISDNIDDSDTINHNTSMLSFNSIESDIPQIDSFQTSSNTVSLSYLDSGSDNLCMSDIPKLLKEYKLLASIVQQDRQIRVIKIGS